MQSNQTSAAFNHGATSTVHPPSDAAPSDRAIYLRLKRRLAREGIHLRTCRENSRWFNDLGRHYTFNDNNAVDATHIDIDDWARELGIV